MLDKNELIERSKNGDQKSQKELFELLSPHIRVICKKYARDNVEISDMFQESMIQIFQKLHQYDRTGSIEGWAKSVAITRALLTLRKINVLSSCSDISCCNICHIDPQIERNQLLEYLHALDAKNRIVFTLHAIEGYQHKEIASLLGITEKASSSLYYKAKNILKKIYEEYQ